MEIGAEIFLCFRLSRGVDRLLLLDMSKGESVAPVTPYGEDIWRRKANWPLTAGPGAGAGDPLGKESLYREPFRDILPDLEETKNKQEENLSALNFQT